MGLVQAVDFLGDRGFHLLDFLTPGTGKNSQVFRLGGQTERGIVLPQQKAVLGAGGEHSIGFVGALGDQIIDHDPHVGFVALENERFLVKNAEGCVDSGHKALSRSFFISCGSVHLAGKIQAANPLGFQRVEQLRGVEEVIFDGIGRCQKLGLFEARDGMDHLNLHIEWQAVGGSVGIHFHHVASLWFHKHMVMAVAGELDDLVFNGGAIASPGAFNQAAVQR